MREAARPPAAADRTDENRADARRIAGSAQRATTSVAAGLPGPQPAGALPAAATRDSALEVLNITRHARAHFGVGQPALQRGHVVLHMGNAPGGGNRAGDRWV